VSLEGGACLVATEAHVHQPLPFGRVGAMLGAQRAVLGAQRALGGMHRCMHR
jgi:hypothetical protein